MAFNSDDAKDEILSDVNEAATAMRAAATDFADAALDRKDDAVKAAGRATNQFGDLANEMRDYVITSVSRSVTANPLLALAAAAGAGFLFAQWSRGGRR